MAAKRPPVWDCGSSLYDSFELMVFTRQLDSAIAGRTYSMPRLSDPAPGPPSRPTREPKRPSKISESIRRLLRTVLFRTAPAPAAGVVPPPPHGYSTHVDCASYEGLRRRGSRGTVSKGREGGAGPPELGPAVRKTMSERFTGTAVRIYCH